MRAQQNQRCPREDATAAHVSCRESVALELKLASAGRRRTQSRSCFEALAALAEAGDAKAEA
jgi:hypothetical protein